MSARSRRCCGVTRAYYPSSTHGEMTVALGRAPQVFGDAESALHSPWTASVQALTPALALSFPADRYQRALALDPMTCMRQYEDCARRLGFAFRFGRYTNSGAALREKLIVLLLSYAEHFGREVPEGRLIDYPVTQFDLAEQCASNRRDIVRSLGALYREGLVRRMGRQYVLTDPEKLQALSPLKETREESEGGLRAWVP